MVKMTIKLYAGTEAIQRRWLYHVHGISHIVFYSAPATLPHTHKVFKRRDETLQLSRISLGSLNTILFTALPNLLVGSHVRHMKKAFVFHAVPWNFYVSTASVIDFFRTHKALIHFVQHVPCFIFSSASLSSQKKMFFPCKLKSCAHSSAHICIKKKLCSATAIWQNSIWSLFSLSSSLLPRIISNGLD